MLVEVEAQDGHWMSVSRRLREACLIGLKVVGQEEVDGAVLDAMMGEVSEGEEVRVHATEKERG